MGCDIEMNGLTSVMGQDHENKQQAKAHRCHHQDETNCLTWFSRKVRQVCEGGFRCRTMYFATVA